MIFFLLYWHNPWSQCMCWTYCCTTIAASCPKVITNSVVAAGVVVGSILLAGDQLLGVEELAVGPSPDLIHDSWLQVNEHGSVRKIRPSFVSLTSPHLVVVVVVGFLFLTFSFCIFIYSALFLFFSLFSLLHTFFLLSLFLLITLFLSFFLKLPCCLSPSNWSSFLTFVERFQILIIDTKLQILAASGFFTNVALKLLWSHFKVKVYETKNKKTDKQEAAQNSKLCIKRIFLHRWLMAEKCKKSQMWRNLFSRTFLCCFSTRSISSSFSIFWRESRAIGDKNFWQQLGYWVVACVARWIPVLIRIIMKFVATTSIGKHGTIAVCGTKKSAYLTIQNTQMRTNSCLDHQRQVFETSLITK